MDPNQNGEQLVPDLGKWMSVSCITQKLYPVIGMIRYGSRFRGEIEEFDGGDYVREMN